MLTPNGPGDMIEKIRGDKSEQTAPVHPISTQASCDSP